MKFLQSSLARVFFFLSSTDDKKRKEETQKSWHWNKETGEETELCRFMEGRQCEQAIFTNILWLWKKKKNQVCTGNSIPQYFVSYKNTRDTKQKGYHKRKDEGLLRIRNETSY